MSKNIKFGIEIEGRGIEGALKQAVYLEEKELDSVWAGDHSIGITAEATFNWWILLGLIAEHTKRMKIGIGVTDPHRRPPHVLAQTVTTIDILSKGRFILGIGAGEAMSLTPFGIPWDKPVSRMREHIEVLKKLWAQGIVNHDGKFYHYKNAMGFGNGIVVKGQKFELPQKPHPPIWIAGNSSKTRKLTAELANGWMPYAFGPKEYKENLNQIRKWAKEVGRDPEEIEPGVYLPSCLDIEHETARKEFLPAAKFLMCLVPSALRALGYPELAKEEFGLIRWTRTPQSLAALFEHSKKIPDKLVEKHFVFGTPDEVINRLEEWIKAGAKHFIFDIYESKDRSERLIAEKVVPYFRK